MVGFVDTAVAATTTATSSGALFDIDTHIVQRYTGEGQLRRLLWIISNQNSNNNNNNRSVSIVQQDTHYYSVVQTSYETAINQCMISNNTERYKEIFQYYTKYQNSVDTSTTTLNTTAGTSSTTDNNNNNNNNNNKTASTVSLNYNEQWYSESIQQNKNNYDIIHVRLQTAQSHLNKEAIRICYAAIAEYCYSIGNINESLHCSIRAKDYCTTKQQTISIVLQIVFYSLVCNNYKVVIEYIPRLESIITTLSTTTTTGSTGRATGNTSTEGDSSSSNAAGGGEGIGNTGTASSASTTSTNTINTKLIQNCINVASGLEKLYHCNYILAAEKFRLVALSGYNNSNKKSNNTINNNPYNNNNSIITTTTDSSSINSTNTNISMNDPIIWDTIIVSPEDIALYAGILSLAYEDNRSQILNLAENVEALELVPIIKDIVIQFIRYNNYKQSYLLLEQYIVPLVQYDIYLSTHLPTILYTIRIKAIEQYWIPYQIISLSTMAFELGSSIIQPTMTTTTKHESSSSSISRLLLSSSTTTDHDDSDDCADSSNCNILLQTLKQLMISNRSKLGYDTRIDMMNKTLVRDDEMKRYYTTVSKLNTVTNRTINDTYSMLVRIGCKEGTTGGNNNNSSSNMKVSKRDSSSSNWIQNYRPNVDTSDTNFIDDNDYINDNVQISGSNNNNDFPYSKNNKKNSSRNYSNNIYNNTFDEEDDDDSVMNYNNLVATIDEDYNITNNNNDYINNYNVDDDYSDNARNRIMESEQNPEDIY